MTKVNPMMSNFRRLALANGMLREPAKPASDKSAMLQAGQSTTQGVSAEPVVAEAKTSV